VLQKDVDVQQVPVVEDQRETTLFDWLGVHILSRSRAGDQD
jgi:hypothetical protein